MQPPRRTLGPLHDKKCDVWAAGQKTLVPSWSRADAEVEGHDAHNDSEISSEYQHHHNGGALGGGVVGRSTKPVISESSIELGPPPDGVWVAWTQCLIGHLVIFTTIISLSQPADYPQRRGNRRSHRSQLYCRLHRCSQRLHADLHHRLCARVLLHRHLQTCGLYACVILVSVVGAGIQSLFLAVQSFLTTDLRKLGVSMGMAFAIVGFVMLTGPPIAGTILASPARYTSAKVFAASPIAAVCGFSIAGKAARIPSKGLNWISRI
ncbi:hypothetical protein NHJ13051_009494 [Beauveria bassiana]